MNEESVYNEIFYLQSHIQLKYFRIRLKALCSKPSADMFVRSAYATLFSVRLQFFHNLYRVGDLLKFILIVVQFSKIKRYFILMPSVNSYNSNEYNSVFLQSDGARSKDKQIGDIDDHEESDSEEDEEEEGKKKKKKKKNKTPGSTKSKEVVVDEPGSSTPGSSATIVTPGKDSSKKSPMDVTGIVFICKIFQC